MRSAIALALGLATLAGCVRDYTIVEAGMDVPTDTQSDTMSEQARDVTDVMDVRDVGMDIVEADVPVDANCADGGMIGDLQNCGACGHDCTHLPHVAITALVACSSGSCVVPPPACAPGYAHCSSNPDEGCETQILSTTNCGGCGIACPTTQPLCIVNLSNGADAGDAGDAADVAMESGVDAAVDGAVDGSSTDAADADAGPIVPPAAQCGTSCPLAAPDTCPVNICTDLRFDPNNCNSCGHGCRTPRNGNATCTMGVCGFVCYTGFHMCGTDCVDNRSVDTCGSNCTPCPLPMHAVSTTCDGTHCGFVCDSGYTATGGACAPFQPVRLVAPLSTAWTNTARPMFKWELPMTFTGAHVDICSDNACATIETSFEAVGTSGVPTVDLRPGLHYWRALTMMGSARGPTPSTLWEFFVPVIPAGAAPRSPTSYGTTLDTNRDGIAELGVLSDSSNPFPGMTDVYLYNGSTSGPMSPARLSVPRFPSGIIPRVSSAGDMNGDGFGDFAVESQALPVVFFGGSSFPGPGAGYPEPPSAFFLYASGDFDGDGYADLGVGVASSPSLMVFGAPISSGSFGRAQPVGSAAPPFIAAAGDIDADGYADTVDFAGGALHVTFGGPGGRTQTIPSAPVIALNGTRDANGDGFADVVVVSSSTPPMVHLYIGSATGLSGSSSFTIPEPRMGTMLVSMAGDLDADGYDDTIVANGPSLWTLYGAATPWMRSPRNFWSGLSSVSSITFGSDMNGDGLPDGVVGSAPASVAGTFYDAPGGLLVMGPQLHSVTGTPGFGVSVSLNGMSD